jgi:hypothetical protein
VASAWRWALGAALLAGAILAALLWTRSRRQGPVSRDAVEAASAPPATAPPRFEPGEPPPAAPGGPRDRAPRLAAQVAALTDAELEEDLQALARAHPEVTVRRARCSTRPCRAELDAKSGPAMDRYLDELRVRYPGQVTVNVWAPEDSDGRRAAVRIGPPPEPAPPAPAPEDEAPPPP